MGNYNFYVVWVGHRPGVYKTWEECRQQVHHFPGAKFKGFVTYEEAMMAYSERVIQRCSSSSASSFPVTQSNEARYTSNASQREPQRLQLATPTLVAIALLFLILIVLIIILVELFVVLVRVR